MRVRIRITRKSKPTNKKMPLALIQLILLAYTETVKLINLSMEAQPLEYRQKQWERFIKVVTPLERLIDKIVKGIEKAFDDD